MLINAKIESVIVNIAANSRIEGLTPAAVEVTLRARFQALPETDPLAEMLLDIVERLDSTPSIGGISLSDLFPTIDDSRPLNTGRTGNGERRSSREKTSRDLRDAMEAMKEK